MDILYGPEELQITENKKEKVMEITNVTGHYKGIYRGCPESLPSGIEEDSLSYLRYSIP